MPEAWADDGTTWDNPDVVLSEGPQSIILSSGDLDYIADMPRSGRVGFTVEPGPVRVDPTATPCR